MLSLDEFVDSYISNKPDHNPDGNSSLAVYKKSLLGMIKMVAKEGVKDIIYLLSQPVGDLTLGEVANILFTLTFFPLLVLISVCVRKKKARKAVVASYNRYLKFVEGL